MAVTKKHVFTLFVAGWPIRELAARYPFTPDPIRWVESAIRQYMGK